MFYLCYFISFAAFFSELVFSESKDQGLALYRRESCHKEKEENAIQDIA